MRSEAAYLADILQACETIKGYIGGHTLETFQAAMMIQDAVYYRLLIIGEATRYLTDETKAQMPAIPWPAVKRTRNILVHDYFHVDETIIWETAVRDVPLLASSVRTILGK